MKKAISLVFGFGTIIAFLILSIRFSAFNVSWYTDFYQSIGLAQQLDVSEETLDEAITSLVEYVDGKRDSIDPVFNQKERDHMVDVRDLWMTASHVGTGLLVLSILLLVIFMYRHEQVVLARGLLQAYGGFAVILVFLGFWILVDFNGFWTMFHHVFFSNNLWLLDPATDFMIRICPESMFSALIGRILLWFFAFSLMAIAAALIELRITRLRAGNQNIRR